ncbi:hypothetical protein TNCV_4592781 [Trichonephila clavipes]|nr:hypothetical protein TNCV_4592781 [Trichonephila clavipes]
MCGICLAEELQPVNSLPPVYWNFGGHCLMSDVIFAKYSACLGVEFFKSGAVRSIIQSPPTNYHTCSSISGLMAMLVELTIPCDSSVYFQAPSYQSNAGDARRNQRNRSLGSVEAKQ